MTVDRNSSPPIHQRKFAMGRILICVGCQDVLIVFDACRPRKPERGWLEPSPSPLFHHRKFSVEGAAAGIYPLRHKPIKIVLPRAPRDESATLSASGRA